MKKFITFLIILIALYALWFGYRLNWRDGDSDLIATINIPEGASFVEIQEDLIEKGILPKRDGWLLRWYAKKSGLDTKLAVGEVGVVIGASASKIAEAIANKPREVKKLTIIEGWDLHDLKDYLIEQDIKGAKDLFDYTGVPGRDYREESGQPSKFLEKKFEILKDKPWYVSMEGYLFPDTYEIYTDATVEDVLIKMLAEMDPLFNEGTRQWCRFHDMTIHECLTMASIVENEVRGHDDRRKVVDILLRRTVKNWAMQVDSSVNYITREDRPGITIKQKDIDSPYNTYKYPGFPLGPISMPSEDALGATINPWGNNFYYFLTDPEGNVHYGETLEQHNANKARYLK